MDYYINNVYIKDAYEKNGYKDLKLICYNINNYEKVSEKKLYKTKLCKFYKKYNKCDKEDNCSFAHGKHELKEFNFHNTSINKENKQEYNIYNKKSMYDDISYSFDIQNKNYNEDNNVNIKLTLNGKEIKDNKLSYTFENSSQKDEISNYEEKSIHDLIKEMDDVFNLYIEKIKQKSNNLKLKFELNKIKKDIYLLKHNIDDKLLI